MHINSKRQLCPCTGVRFLSFFPMYCNNYLSSIFRISHELEKMHVHFSIWSGLFLTTLAITFDYFTNNNNSCPYGHFLFISQKNSLKTCTVHVTDSINANFNNAPWGPNNKRCMAQLPSKHNLGSRSLFSLLPAEVMVGGGDWHPFLSSQIQGQNRALPRKIYQKYNIRYSMGSSSLHCEFLPF